jgi:hypothetical protein
VGNTPFVLAPVGNTPFVLTAVGNTPFVLAPVGNTPFVLAAIGNTPFVLTAVGNPFVLTATHPLYSYNGPHLLWVGFLCHGPLCTFNIERIFILESGPFPALCQNCSPTLPALLAGSVLGTTEGGTVAPPGAYNCVGGKDTLYQAPQQ